MSAACSAAARSARRRRSFSTACSKDVYSNAPAGKTKQLKDSLKSRKNTVVDLGEDEFTVGRPHPMIDFSLRNKRILAEAEDPETAVILLDVVLGYGSNMDPAAELSPVIREAAKKVAVVCSVTGTDRGSAEPEQGRGGAGESRRDRDAVERGGVQIGGDDCEGIGVK